MYTSFNIHIITRIPTRVTQVAVNAILQKLLLLFIGLTTPIGCAIGAFFYLENRPDYVSQHSPVYAGIAVFLLAFLITSATCQVTER